MHKTQSTTNSASLYFNENWQRYVSTVKNNTLYHREMLASLRQFLDIHMSSRAFSFVDVGCGDSSMVAPILLEQNITKYTGIDAAEDVLKLAADNLVQLHCEKEFIADNMSTAVPNLSSPVDIIFTSYAVHHLSLQDKIHFIHSCKQQLNPHGFLLMIDGVLKPNQSRDEWLSDLKARIEETNVDITSDETAIRMAHPAEDDFPESIETLADIAQQQAWKDFQVLVDKDIFAFMVFAK